MPLSKKDLVWVVVDNSFIHYQWLNFVIFVSRYTYENNYFEISDTCKCEIQLSCTNDEILLGFFFCIVYDK